MKCFNFVFVILFFIMGCSSWKEVLVSQGDQNDAIHNAIIDFMHTCKLRRNDKVFSVNVYVNEKNTLILTILGCDSMKLFPRPVDKVGAYSAYFPSEYILQDGKLFYWRDSTKAITEEIVSVLTKYNYIDSLNVDSIVGIPFFTNESKKGVYYFFCKNDLRKYKKKVSNRGLRWVKRPELKCGDSFRKKE